MNIFQLTCFLAVAENLNFARAAEQLHITQPAVTQQIHALERELNVKLFIRTTRIVKLTEEGKTFLNDAHQMVAISERAKKRFENIYDSEIQLLSLGCYNYPCLFLLSDALKSLAADYPKLHPRLQVVPFRQIYRMLEEGDIDAAVGFKEVNSAKITASYKEVTKVPLVCICAADHPLAKQSSVKMDDLKKEQLVLFTPTRSSVYIAQLQGQLMGGRSPSEFYFCESGEAISVLVKAGYGISILPDLFVPKALEISQIPIEGTDPVSFGVYYKNLHGNKILKSFIEKLRESCSL